MDLSKYLGLFLSEARDHLGASERLIEALSEAPEPPIEDLRALFRHVHSIKGMASTMGYACLATLAHALEDMLDTFRCDRPDVIRPDTTELLWASLACMRRIVDAVAAGRDPYDGLADPLAERLRRAAHVDESGPPTSAPPNEVRSPARRGTRIAVEVEFQDDCKGARAVLQLIASIGRLGRVERILPPVVVNRESETRTRRLSAIVRTTRTPESVRRQLAALTGVFEADVTALAEERPRIRAAPLPPTAQLRIRADVADGLMATAAELSLAQDGLLGMVLPEADPETQREARRCQALARRLLTAISEVRLVPFDTVTHRFAAGAEDAARRLGKRVRISVEGGDVRIDRSLLEAIVDPLMHIARNAVAHGIEPIEERIDIGKPAPGRIRLAVIRTRDRIRVEVEDDGRGMDPAAIREAAVRSGEISETASRTLSRERLLELVMRPGFTTARAGGPLAGRGVGMDVVARAVLELGGRLRIRSEPGQGSTFVLDLPQSQTVIPALLCRASGDLYAVPIDAIQRTVSLAGASLREVEAGIELVEKDRAWSLRPLAERLGAGGTWIDPPRSAAALIFEEGGGSIAAVVEEVLGRRDILVRPLEAPLRSLPWFTGSTLLDDGSVALVVDPTALL